MSNLDWDCYCLTWQLIGILYYCGEVSKVTGIYTTYTTRFDFNLC